MRRFLNKLRLNLRGGTTRRGAEGETSRQKSQNGALQDEDLPAALTAQIWGPLDLTNDGIVLLDPSWKIMAANARALALLQCPLASVRGCDFWEAVAEEIAEQYQSATCRAMSSLTRRTFVANHEFEDRWIEYTFSRYPPGYVVNLRDVAATQRMRRLLEDNVRYNQLIFEANPNAMWIFDSDSLRILSVNQAAVEFYGIARKKFLTLQMGALFPDGEGAELLSSLYSPVKATREAPLDLRLCKQQKMDGELVLVELACGQVNWNGHQSVLVSLADLTQRHLADSTLRRINTALEETLALRQCELQNANRDLAAFTQAVTSDLQDSLHVANGFAAKLADKYSALMDEQGRHYVSRIQASTCQLAKLVDDLRTLAQLSQQAGNLEKFDLVPVCRLIFADLRHQDPDRVVAIEMETTLPLIGDKRLLITAMGCLLENAWKFTSKKSEAWIKVGLQSGNNPGDLTVVVSDNGAGFDATYGSKLFKAFQRLHSSADFPGNGLGLAIVKRVAERHGATVWAETADQAGASFFMELPQVAGPDR
jgi:PAS domain S-box-containing protein